MTATITIPADAVFCERNSFIALSEGVLLERNAAGEVRIGDTVDAHRALFAAENGQEVILTIDGKPFSKVVNFREVEL